MLSQFLHRLKRQTNYTASDEEVHALITCLRETFGLSPRNQELYRQALTHRSLLRDVQSGHTVSNERLEFLGDAVLDLAVADFLFHRYPEEPEGTLTRLRAKLVRREALADFARKIGLQHWVKISSPLERSGGRENLGVLADALEAVIGAVYLDLGYEAARMFVHELLNKFVNLEELRRRKENFKSMLLEEAQARGWPQPRYVVVAESGPDHAKEFTIEVRIGEKPFGKGVAGSKKAAEQEAARQALQRITLGGEPTESVS